MNRCFFNMPWPLNTMLAFERMNEFETTRNYHWCYRFTFSALTMKEQKMISNANSTFNKKPGFNPTIKTRLFHIFH